MTFLVQGDYIKRGKKDGMQTFKEKGSYGHLNSQPALDPRQQEMPFKIESAYGKCEDILLTGRVSQLLIKYH